MYLFADPKGQEGKDRLGALLATTDGFELAEYDLRLRGEGQILGDRQHGLPALRLASVLDRRRTHRDRPCGRAHDRSRPTRTWPQPQHRPLLAEVKRVFREAWEWVSSG